jgi:hypothetical protein
VLALVTGVILTGLAPPVAASEEGLELLGRLSQPKPGIINFDSIGLEPVTRRLYLRGFLAGSQQARMLEYDLTSRVPTLRRVTDLPTSEATIISPYTVSFDVSRKRAFVLDETPGECPICSVIKILDLETLRVRPETWNLSLMVPGFYASGITYSPADDRVYAVGAIPGYAASPANTLGAGPAIPVMVIAVDATTGRLAWASHVTKCQYPGVALFRGAGIFRSLTQQALYLPCIRPDPTALDAGAYPGTSAVVRLWIDPGADTSEAAAFRSEIFPISGRYVNGGGVNTLAVFDEGSDRVYLSNNAVATSGTWVFDGRLSAWVGYVPAADTNNLEIGLDQSSGHLFMRSGADGNLIVTDGRATPVPQGQTFQLYPVGQTASSNFYLSDPLTNRVFVRQIATKPGAPQQMLVYHDRTPSGTAAEADDYDTLTLDVPEGPQTFATFAGNVNGYGVRATMVGGYTGSIAPVIQSTRSDPVKDSGLGISPGPRSIALARIGSIDARNVGVSASAQSIAPDALTADEYETRRQELERSGGPQETAAQQIIWPWPAAVCVDAGEAAKQTKEGSFGRSVVDCRLADEKVAASSAVDALSVDVLSIASSSFESVVSRTEDAGTVTRSTALVRGVDVTVPNVGRLHIARVAATVQTAAHGRPGTAAVGWTREIDGVLLTDASGKVLFRCPEDCSPKAVADAVNESIGHRIRIDIPGAAQTTSPRGAFAGIKKLRSDSLNALIVNDDDSEAVPALEILILNDTSEKSRLDIQLAAIEASSIYGISLLPKEGDLLSPPLVDLPQLPPVADLGPGPDLGNTPPIAQGPGGPALATTRSSLFAVRSPADAFFLSLICLLILATIVGGVRRHRFAGLVNGGSQR